MTSTIIIKFYGAFRQITPCFQGADHIDLILALPCQIADVRAAFKDLLSNHCPEFNLELLNYSVFASNEAILTDDVVIHQATELAIIPPISGG